MRNPLVRRLQTYFCRSNKYVTIAQDCTFNIVSISPARATIGPKIEKECQKNEKKKKRRYSTSNSIFNFFYKWIESFHGQ